MGSWGFHVAALALAPISLGQAVIAGGLVFLTVFADRLFGLSVSRREWIGVALAALGLAVLTLSLDSEAGSGAHSDYRWQVLLAYTVLAVLVGLGAAIWARGRRTGVRSWASRGLLWGVPTCRSRRSPGTRRRGW